MSPVRIIYDLTFVGFLAAISPDELGWLQVLGKASGMWWKKQPEQGNGNLQLLSRNAPEAEGREEMLGCHWAPKTLKLTKTVNIVSEEKSEHAPQRAHPAAQGIQC